MYEGIFTLGKLLCSSFCFFERDSLNSCKICETSCIKCATLCSSGGSNGGASSGPHRSGFTTVALLQNCVTCLPLDLTSFVSLFYRKLDSTESEVRALKVNVVHTVSILIPILHNFTILDEGNTTMNI